MLKLDPLKLLIYTLNFFLNDLYVLTFLFCFLKHNTKHKGEPNIFYSLMFLSIII